MCFENFINKSTLSVVKLEKGKTTEVLSQCGYTLWSSDLIEWRR